MKASSKKLLTLGILSTFLFPSLVFAEEPKSPVQEILIDNSYLTKAHVQTNSKTEIQTITVKKSFLVWVTIRKGKDTATDTNNTK